MISLTVRESHSHDIFKPVVRMDRSTMEALGVIDGQIVYVTGKRRTVAKCMLLEKESPNSVFMNASVRNNAEMPIGGTVQIEKIDSISDASKLVLLSSFQPNEEEQMGNLRNADVLAHTMAGSPVVKGDYVISLSMGAGWEVFELIDIQTSSGSSEGASFITPSTQMEIVRAVPAGHGSATSTSRSSLRAYPLFVITFQETVRKIDDDNIFLIMAFHGLHRDGRFGGEIQRKISIDTDIQSLASQIKETAERTADLINEESRIKTISPTDVQNRITQSVLTI